MGLNRSSTFDIIQVDLTTDATVTHGPTTEQMRLTPPKGFAYQVIAWQIDIPDPAGSSSGTHVLTCYHSNANAIDNRLFMATGNTGNKINVGRYFQMVADSESPTQNVDQAAILRDACWCTNDFPILFEYENKTDVDQAGTRTLKLLVKKHPLGS